MVKKRFIVLVFVLMVFLVNTKTVSANSGPPIIGITVMPTNCSEEFVDGDYVYEFPGNFDLLVKTSEFEADAFGEMNSLYQSFYPFYEEIEYLEEIDEGWTSFSAYYQSDKHFGYGDYYCGMQFGDSRLVSQLSVIKLVYFNDLGETLYISEEIEVPSVYFFQDRDGLITFDTDTLEVFPELEPYTNPYMFLVVILVLGFILFSVVIEIVVASIFRLFTKKALLNVLLINFVTQVSMYVYFLLIFDGYEDKYFTHLFVAEVFVLGIEFAYLYWRLHKNFTWKRLALYVVISNLVSYLLGLLRYY